jgi:hypothetical protein
MKARLEYRAVVVVDVDLESGEVESVIVRAATDDDERVDLTVSLDSDEEQPDEVYERGQQIVDAAAPFELSGWWAPSPEQRWAPVVEGGENDEREDEVEEAPVRLHPRPAKAVGALPPYALAYREELPPSHREALRRGAIVYLDECYGALAELRPGESCAESPIGWYLPRRYEHYYDGRFARDWIAAITVVGWKLAQEDEVTLSCVGEELALWALIKQAQLQLEISEEASDSDAWDAFRDAVFEDEDFLWLYSPELDGIEESEWGRQHAVVNLKFSEWFKPFSVAAFGAPHPFNLD